MAIFSVKLARLYEVYCTSYSMCIDYISILFKAPAEIKPDKAPVGTLSIEDSAFESLEKDFQEVLQELMGDRLV